MVFLDRHLLPLMATVAVLEILLRIGADGHPAADVARSVLSVCAAALLVHLVIRGRRAARHALDPRVAARGRSDMAGGGVMIVALVLHTVGFVPYPQVIIAAAVLYVAVMITCERNVGA